MLAAIYPVATHAISKTALLIHTMKIFGELPVEHKIHNSLLPRIEINGAVFAVGVEVQLNAGPVNKFSPCQLPMQLGGVL